MTSPTIDTRWGEYTPNSAVVSNLDETYRQLRNLMDLGYSKRISEERKKAQRKDLSEESRQAHVLTKVPPCRVYCANFPSTNEACFWSHCQAVSTNRARET